MISNLEYGRFVNDYYSKPVDKPLGMRVDMIAQTIATPPSPQDPPLEMIREKVLEKFLQSPTPEDLRPVAPVMLANLLRKGALVYLWTIGDEGDYHDPATNTYYPATNLQRAKITQSHLMERVGEALGVDYAAIQNLHISISSQDKIPVLRSILEEAAAQGYQWACVTDDQPRNIERAIQETTDIPIELHDYWLNNGDSHGNLDACNTYLQQKIDDNNEKGIKSVFIFDLDDTVMSVDPQLRRVHNGIVELFNLK